MEATRPYTNPEKAEAPPRPASQRWVWGDDGNTNTGGTQAQAQEDENEHCTVELQYNR